MNSKIIKIMLVFVGLAIIYSVLITGQKGAQAQKTEITYDHFIKDIKNHKVLKVRLKNREVLGINKNGDVFTTTIPQTGDTGLVKELLDNGVKIQATKPQHESLISKLFWMIAPLVILVLLFSLFMNKSVGGKGGNPFAFGKSKAKLIPPDMIKTTFQDVAGSREAIEEVKEIVDFLKEPQKYWKLGAKIPRGLLMLGPPGTGKTLLAKAVAGEAKVPFYSISGSDFVEMFIGVGASRVRSMFEEARKNAPCIIFIDEIDAMGRTRGSGVGGGNDEREQTLNQMLVEMDGFDDRDAVIVMAATNRADVLDKALLRPGRFDRQVTVGLPDIKGRTEILKVHIRGKNVSEDFEPETIARGTPMFSGADLANLCNEAGLIAAKNNRDVIQMHDFEEAKDKILMGASKQGFVMNEKEKMNTAYHEAGHAIVGWVMGEEESHDPVYKVSILPRGRALGVTMYLPEEDKYSLSYKEAIAQICSLYGGRIAEEMTAGEGGVTTGASNDIERATEIAYNMVTRWGYSQKLGHTLFSVKESGAGFSGYNYRPISSDTQKIIDEEVKRITDECYDKASSILETKKDQLKIMKDALMQYETIDKDQIEDILKNNQFPRPPKNWSNNNDQNTSNNNGPKGQDKEGDELSAMIDEELRKNGKLL